MFVRAGLRALQDDSAGALATLRDASLPAEAYDRPGLNGRNVLLWAGWKAADWAAFRAAARHRRADSASNATAENFRRSIEGMAFAQRLDFDEAAALFAEARERAAMQVGEGSVLAAMTTGPHALVRYERGEVAEAEIAVLDELPVIEAAVFHESFLRAYTVLIRAAAVRADFARAMRLVDRAMRLAADRGWPRLVAAFLLTRTRLQLRERRVEDAEATVARLRGIGAEHPAPERCNFSEIHMNLAVAEGLLAVASGKPGVAVGHLSRAFGELQETDNRLDSLRVGLELANAHFRVGSSDRALALLHQVLRWAADANAISFLRERGDEFITLLAWARRSAAIGADAAASGLIDRVLLDSAAGREALRDTSVEAEDARPVLSARERSIVEFIAGGQSNKQIARTLGLGPETIKTHMKRIFVKLSAESRAQAVARAQGLGLLRDLEVG